MGERRVNARELPELAVPSEEAALEQASYVIGAIGFFDAARRCPCGAPLEQEDERYCSDTCYWRSRRQRRAS